MVSIGRYDLGQGVTYLQMSPSSGKICVGIAAAVAMLCVSPGALTVASRASEANAPAKSSPPTVTESVVYSFCNQPDHNLGACLDGATPNGVIEGSDGDFYGTTGPLGVGNGTMFKLTPSGTLTTLHSFCFNKDPNRGDCLDGSGPGAVIEGSDGNFYGTAGTGGANFEFGGGTAGTAYMITPSGTLTTLYSFCAQVDPITENCLDGEEPVGILEGSDGNFYGTTFSGGPNSFGGARPAGTVFKMTPSGVLTTLYSFCSEEAPITGSCLDGEEPRDLIEGSDGNFYGTTPVDGQFGRATVSGGTVFKLTPSGTLTTLHSFCSEKDPNTGNCLDGDGPGGLIEGSDGNFYGTTSGGGANGDGSVFRLTPSGTLTTLYSFCSKGNPNTFSCLDGADPSAVIEGSDGNFYGTTRSGGDLGNENRDGTAFMLTPSGTLTTLYYFCSQQNPTTFDCLDGAGPNGGFIQAGDGNFYGTTVVGGANGQFGFGTLFKLAVSSPTAVRANLTISPGEHSFGTTRVGTTRHESFLVRASSRGNATTEVVLGSFTISGNDYSVDPAFTTCKQGQVLQMGQTCKIVVDFMPLMARKTYTGTLNVTSNAEEVQPKHGVVTLTGGSKKR